MKRLEAMQDTLIAAIQGQMSHLDTVDAKELGEAVDMIKDLAETMYYCTITEAMEKKEHEEPKYYRPYYRDVDRDYGRMYYDEAYDRRSTSTDGHNGQTHRSYADIAYPTMRLDMRDKREGKSPVSRRSYMEAKEMHHDKTYTMKELENYMQELGEDIAEMINDASPEEKQLMQKKLNLLASKIA